MSRAEPPGVPSSSSCPPMDATAPVPLEDNDPVGDDVVDDEGWDDVVDDEGWEGKRSRNGRDPTGVVLGPSTGAARGERE